MPIENTRSTQSKKNQKAKILCSLVIEEATNLREYATKKELNKLNLKNLYPSCTDTCIYGQMTGDCYSARAHKLISMCTSKIYKGNLRYFKLNGNPKTETLSERLYLVNEYYSPIEIFIANCLSEDKKSIINFLKGKTKTLKLKTKKLYFETLF